MPETSGTCSSGTSGTATATATTIAASTTTATTATSAASATTQGAGVRDDLFRCEQVEYQPNGFKGA